MVVVWTKHFRRKRSLCAGEVVDEVAKGRKGFDRIRGRVVGKGERTTRVDGHELFGSLDHHVETGAERVIAHSVRDRVLELIVVEDATLRESRIRSDARNLRSAAAEKDLRWRIKQVGIAILEHHVEAAVTKAKFVRGVRRESVGPVDVSVLHEARNVNFGARELQR